MHGIPRQSLGKLGEDNRKARIHLGSQAATGKSHVLDQQIVLYFGVPAVRPCETTSFHISSLGSCGEAIGGVRASRSIAHNMSGNQSTTEPLSRLRMSPESNFMLTTIVATTLARQLMAAEKAGNIATNTKEASLTNKSSWSKVTVSQTSRAKGKSCRSRPDIE